MIRRWRLKTNNSRHPSHKMCATSTDKRGGLVNMKKEKTPFWKVPEKSECRTLTDEEKQAVYQEILERAAANDGDYGNGLQRRTA
jgi:hypothetical protein